MTLTEPPKIPDRFIPVVRDYLAELRKWLMGQRVVEGLNVSITDAGGGGKKITSKAGGGPGAGMAVPFYVLPTSPPTGQTGDNWVKVELYSHLLKSIKPTDKVTITGLDSAFRLNVDEFVWLTVDIQPTYLFPKQPPTATIEHGPKWNPSSGIFPDPILWDTDDGTPTGSDPANTPVNRKQTYFFVPLARTIEPESEAAEPGGVLLGDDIKLIQCWTSHLLIARSCYLGDEVSYVIPFGPWFPEP